MAYSRIAQPDLRFDPARSLLASQSKSILGDNTSVLSRTPVRAKLPRPTTPQLGPAATVAESKLTFVPDVIANLSSWERALVRLPPICTTAEASGASEASIKMPKVDTVERARQYLRFWDHLSGQPNHRSYKYFTAEGRRFALELTGGEYAWDGKEEEWVANWEKKGHSFSSFATWWAQKMREWQREHPEVDLSVPGPNEDGEDMETAAEVVAEGSQSRGKFKAVVEDYQDDEEDGGGEETGMLSDGGVRPSTLVGARFGTPVADGAGMAANMDHLTGRVDTLEAYVDTVASKTDNTAARVDSLRLQVDGLTQGFSRLMSSTVAGPATGRLGRHFSTGKGRAGTRALAGDEAATQHTKKLTSAERNAKYPKEVQEWWHWYRNSNGRVNGWDMEKLKARAARGEI